MAAFAKEDANKVWGRIKLLTMDASPAVQKAWRELRSYISQHRVQTQLQLLTFSAADAAAAGGTQLGTGALKVYGVYVKKTGTATQNTVKLYDDATDDTTAANAIAAFDLRIANEEQFWIDPVGKTLANGIVLTAHTTLLGTTDGSAANAGSGFIIIG